MSSKGKVDIGVGKVGAPNEVEDHVSSPKHLILALS